MGSEWEETEEIGIAEGLRANDSAVSECQEPAVCSRCGTPFTLRKWSWKAMPKEPDDLVCPACRRIANRYPAGYIEVKGQMLSMHHVRIVNLLREIESQMKKEQPLERIMEIVPSEEHILITTTGASIARRIGEALSRTYEGNLYLENCEDEDFIRIIYRKR
ncbi:MAG: BCAM0308 family protein [Desulforhabdus sp.]|nr:BCAM0308 family protein [Desulforhabdus sp.]